MRPGILVLLGASVAVAQSEAFRDVRDEARGWRMEIPQDWTDAPPEFLQLANDVARQQAPHQAIEYVAAWVPPTDSEQVHVYLLAQCIEHPAGQPSVADVQRSFQVTRMRGDIAKVFPDLGSFAIGDTAFDPQAGRVVMRAQSTAPGYLQQITSVGFLGLRRDIILHFYAPDAKMVTFQEDLRRLVQSFTFDDQIAWNSRTVTPQESAGPMGGRSGDAEADRSSSRTRGEGGSQRSWGKILGKAIAGGVGALVVGALLLRKGNGGRTAP